MDHNLSTLKRLAVCFGCCKGTEDNPAKSNAEALDYICDNFTCKGASCSGGGGVTNIELKVGNNGKVTGGTWTDAAGVHAIKII